jgi:hypothetical protein
MKKVSRGKRERRKEANLDHSVQDLVILEMLVLRFVVGNLRQRCQRTSEGRSEGKSRTIR